MSKLLLAMLRRFLTLGVAEDDDSTGDSETGGGADATAGTGDDTLDEMLDEIEPGDAKPAKAAAADDEETPRERAARERAEAAERRAADAESRSRQPARAATDPDDERDAEELRQYKAAGWTPEQLSWVERQHKATRSARMAERTSNSALQEAREISDKTTFDRLEATKPGTYKKYADRVERAISDAKAAGQTPPPRLVVLRLMIGDDWMSGKFKTTAAKGKPAAAGTPAGKIARGNMPGARTDVNGKDKAKSESQARIERLRTRTI